MSDLEGTVGYSLPKICVLFPMVVGSRRIADDTETDERYLIYITDLGDGSRFHIYCQPFVELFFNIVKFGTVGDKFVLHCISGLHEWRSEYPVTWRNQTM